MRADLICLYHVMNEYNQAAHASKQPDACLLIGAKVLSMVVYIVGSRGKEIIKICCGAGGGEGLLGHRLKGEKG